MIRKIALAVSLAIAGLGLPVHALGLGEINPKSALNQNFDADIKLLSVEEGELDSVRVSLASSDAFLRAGVARPFYLSQLKFQPMRSDNGDSIVRVTSNSPVREPFLNFLVEVNWPKGRMVREYTTLLDPPTTTLRRAGKIQVASASRAAPVQRAPRKTTAAPKARATAGKQYGPITNSDTAWSIAKQSRPAGVTMAQMLMALLKANPEAFVNDNVNQMRNGQILRIPNKQEILQWDKEAANSAFRQQQDDWLAKRTTQLNALPNKTQPGTTTQAAREPEAQLRIAAKAPENDDRKGAGDGAGVETKDVADLKNKLVLARENAETSRQETESMRSRMDDLEARLLDMQRLLQLKDEQLAQIQDRIAQGAGASDAIQSVAEDIKADAQASAEPTEKQAVEEVDPLDQVMQDVMDQGEAAEEVDQTANSETVAQVEETEPMAEPDFEASDEPHENDALPSWVPIAGAGGAVIAVIGGLLAWRRRKSGKEEAATDESSQLIIDEEDEPQTKVDDVDDGDDVFADNLAELDQDSRDTATDSSFLSEFSPSEINALNDETGEVDPVSEADVYLAYGRYQQAEDLLKQAIDGDPERVALSHKLAEVYYATRNKDAFTALASTMATKGMHESEPDTWNKITDMGKELAPTHALFKATLGDDDFEDIGDLMEEVVDEPVEAAVETVDDGFDNLEDEIDNFDLESPIDEDSLALGEFELSELASDFLPDGEIGKPDEGDDLQLDVVSELADDLENAEPEVAAPSAAEVEAEQLDLSELHLGDPDIDDYEDPIGAAPIPTDMGVATVEEVEESAFPSESEIQRAGKPSSMPTMDDVEGQLLDLADLETDDDDISDFSDAVESIPAFDTDSGVADLQAQLDELSDLAGIGEEVQPNIGELDSLDQDVMDAPASLDDAFDSVDHGDPADDLASFGADAPLLGDADEISTKLDLASAYIEMGDADGAKSILEEVYADGNEAQKAEADKLMSEVKG